MKVEVKILHQKRLAPQISALIPQTWSAVKSNTAEIKDKKEYF